MCISIKNHGTHTKTSNLSTRLWHYMANSSFSKVIDRETTKVPYTVYVELLTIRSKMQLARFSFGVFDHCMDRKSCLQPK